MLHPAFNRFLDHSESVLSKIDSYSKLGGIEIPKNQLTIAEERIREMSQSVRDGNLPPKSKRYKSMTRIIIDEWPLGHSLGESISNLEEEYTRLP